MRKSIILSAVLAVLSFTAFAGIDKKYYNKIAEQV